LKGSLNEVLAKSKYFNNKDKEDELNNESIKQFLATAENLMSSGMRVIGMARGTSFNDLTFVGMVGIIVYNIIDPEIENIIEYNIIGRYNRSAERWRR
jgi:magnesium-transporting ATPase (P-type)